MKVQLTDLPNKVYTHFIMEDICSKVFCTDKTSLIGSCLATHIAELFLYIISLVDSSPKPACILIKQLVQFRTHLFVM